MVAPGCHGPNERAPTLSWHKTFALAVARARRSDRVTVMDAETGGRCWTLPQQNDPELGAGRYGNGAKRGKYMPRYQMPFYEPVEG